MKLRERCAELNEKIWSVPKLTAHNVDLIEAFAREIRNEALEEACKAIVFMPCSKIIDLQTIEDHVDAIRKLIHAEQTTKE